MIDAVGPVALRDSGVRMYLPAGCERVTPAIVKARTWECSTTRWLLSGLRRGDAFLDVGAHAGYYTLLASKAIGPDGMVFAFEPDPENFELLERNVELNGCRNVMCERAAATNRSGVLRLHRSPKNSGDHRIIPDGDRVSCEVPGVVLDEILNGQAIDSAKIDTQGAEGLVIEGMSKLLGGSRRMRLIVEFWPYGLTNAGCAGADLLTTLIGYGFPIPRAEVARLLAAHTPENRKHTNLLLERGA